MILYHFTNITCLSGVHEACCKSGNDIISSSSCSCEQGCLLNTMFTELSLGCWSSGHRISFIRFTQCFSLSVACTHMVPFSSRLVVVRNDILLNTTLFVRSQSFICFNAVVSEIRKLNQNNEIANSTITRHVLHGQRRRPTGKESCHTHSYPG